MVIVGENKLYFREKKQLSKYALKIILVFHISIFLVFFLSTGE